LPVTVAKRTFHVDEKGKEIQFLVRKQDKDEIVSGKIIRSGYVPHQSGLQRYGQDYAQRQMAYSQGSSGQPIIKVAGKVRFNLPGEPLFPALADDTILKPTLHWMLETDKAGKLNAELSYVTGGLSWEADYSMLAQTESDAIDVIGWVTMDSQTIEFRVQVPAGEEKVITYRVHYTW